MNTHTPYFNHLEKDRKLRKIIHAHGSLTLTKRKNIFNALVSSIMAQQLSIKVADIIHKRFLNLFNGKEPSPTELLNQSFEELRSVGLSGSKVRYIQNVARFDLEKGLQFKMLDKMTDEEIITYLTQISGVGRWTAEMQLIFSFGREDVFSIDDVGLQNAMKVIYKLDHTNPKILKQNMLQIAQEWVPYRSYACLHLWRYKDFK